MVTSCAHLCDSANSLLVVIDIQTRLGESMPGKVLGRVVENTTLLIESAKLLDVPLVASEQYPKGLGGFVPEIANLLPSDIDYVQKTCFSCCGSDEFMQQLKASGRKQIILTGMEAHVCVLQTAMELMDNGFEVYVVGDAICSRRLDNYQNALERMERCGIHLISTESVVFEWLRDAKHASFKDIAALLR